MSSTGACRQLCGAGSLCWYGYFWEHAYWLLFPRPRNSLAVQHPGLYAPSLDTQAQPLAGEPRTNKLHSAAQEKRKKRKDKKEKEKKNRKQTDKQNSREIAKTTAKNSSNNHTTHTYTHTHTHRKRKKQTNKQKTQGDRQTNKRILIWEQSIRTKLTKTKNDK